MELLAISKTLVVIEKMTNFKTFVSNFTVSKINESNYMPLYI